MKNEQASRRYRWRRLPGRFAIPGQAGLALLLSLALATTCLAAPADSESPLGLADSAALRAMVFGPDPENLAPLPETVPTREMNIAIEGGLPVPDVFWFNRKLRVHFSEQPGPAPLAILIAGTGGNADSQKLRLLRRALYAAGHHVLTLPSPTFPGFIVAASSTGVAGDLYQDGLDLHRVATQLVGQLRGRKGDRFTEINVIGYSLGGANAAMLKAIDGEAGTLGIRRAVAINPPVSLFSTIGRLDHLLELSVGDNEQGFDRLYHDIYTQLSSLYAVSDAMHIDQDFLLGAAASVLDSDRRLAAGISLSFRMSLINLFFAGDIYTGAGVATDPQHPPRRGDSLEEAMRVLRHQSFSAYFERVFAPFYLARRPGATRESLIADNHLEIIGDLLRSDPDYYAQTNADELILDREDLDWLRRTFGPRLVVYDHGGHLGNLGEKQQIQDLLDMVSGRYARSAP
ncbi:MAG: hypothetical protein WC247_15650 [Porticoccaceae bacterium]